MNVIVIGAGASGLVASIYASKNNKVIVLEKNNICGKKILVTGNGRCNYWNENFDINNFNSSNIDLVKQIISDDNQKEILRFFDRIGIIPKIKDGYFYPYSKEAITIKDALVREALRCNVEIKNNIDVKKITYKNEFIIETNNGIFKADKVIVATGSKAAPITGSDGFGYDIAREYGHNIIKVLPSLVQLKTNGSYLKDWAGIRSDVIVSLYENGTKIDTEKGEIQLTNYGVSGICVFQLSSKISRGLDSNKEEIIKINFLPFLENKTKEEIITFINDRSKKMNTSNINELLEGLINNKLIKIILKESSVKNCDWNFLNDEIRINLINNLISFKVKVIGTNSFDNAQVCTGGIDLTEINTSTMESLKQKGLYFTGELLDADGKCGGYNLGFAWITGYLAGFNVGGNNVKS